MNEQKSFVMLFITTLFLLVAIMNEYPIDNSMISFIIDTALVNQDLIVPYNKEEKYEKTNMCNYSFINDHS